MALDRVNGFMNSYNAYNIPSAADNKISSDAPSLKPQYKEAENEPQKKEEPSKGLDLTVKEVSPRENASIENVAISFGQYDSSSIELFGESGLASDDMRQAISGMKRDQILHEYQYFVGGKDLAGKDRNIIAGTEDGIVIKL